MLKHFPYICQFNSYIVSHSFIKRFDAAVTRCSALYQFSLTL